MFTGHTYLSDKCLQYWMFFATVVLTVYFFIDTIRFHLGSTKRPRNQLDVAGSEMSHLIIEDSDLLIEKMVPAAGRCAMSLVSHRGKL